jgi:tetratricopeptide (TPR) repeat protein
MKTLARHAFIIASSLALLPAQGAGGDDPPPRGGPPADPVVERVIAANAQKDWQRSQEILRDALLKDPRNPDYHNLYAYAVRKGDKPNLDIVFKHYNEALRIDPKHRGAHEYIGEAYLMVGNVGKAKEHLSSLDSLCFFGCDEYTKLKKAVAEFEAKGK